VKRVNHTAESSPMIQSGLTVGDEPWRSTIISHAWINRNRAFLGPGPIGLGISGALFLFAGITSFTIFPLSTSSPLWIRYYASICMFIPVLLSSSMWVWVFITEQLPTRGTPWWPENLVIASTSSDFTLGSHHKDPPVSPAKGILAIRHVKETSIVYGCAPVRGKEMLIIRTLSCIASITMAFAYACQYVAISQTSAAKSGIWLAIQAALAFTRVVAWMLQPHFQRLGEWRCEPAYGVRVERHLEHWSVGLSELEFLLAWSRISEGSILGGFPVLSAEERDSFRIPVWASDALRSLDLPSALSVSQEMRETYDPDPSKWGLGQEISNLHLSREWRIPPSVSKSFIESRYKDHEISQKLKDQFINKSLENMDNVMENFELVLQQLSDGSIHLLPAFSISLQRRNESHRTQIQVFKSPYEYYGPSSPRARNNWLLRVFVQDIDVKSGANDKSGTLVYGSTKSLLEKYKWDRSPLSWKDSNASRNYSSVMHLVDGCYDRVSFECPSYVFPLNPGVSKISEPITPGNSILPDLGQWIEFLDEDTDPVNNNTIEDEIKPAPSRQYSKLLVSASSQSEELTGSSTKEFSKIVPDDISEYLEGEVQTTEEKIQARKNRLRQRAHNRILEML
jgi:hypothetical protein